MSAPSLATLQALPLTVGNLRPASTWADPAWYNAGFRKAITSYQPQGWSFYNGLDLEVKRRFAHGLQFLAAYTWSTTSITNRYPEHQRAEPAPRGRISGNLTPEKAASALDRRKSLYPLRHLRFAVLQGQYELVPEERRGQLAGGSGADLRIAGVLHGGSSIDSNSIPIRRATAPS